MAVKPLICRPTGVGGIEITGVDETGDLRTIHLPPERLSEDLATIVTAMTEADPGAGQAPTAGPIHPVPVVMPTAFGVGHSADGMTGFLVHFGRAHLGIALPSSQLADIGRALISAGTHPQERGPRRRK